MLSDNDKSLIGIIRNAGRQSPIQPSAGHVDSHDDHHNDSTHAGTHADNYDYTQSPPSHYDYTEQVHDDTRTDHHDDFEEGVAELTGPGSEPAHRQPGDTPQLHAVLARLEVILGVREQQLHRDVGLRLDEFVHEIASRLDRIEDRLARLDAAAASDRVA